MAPSLKLGEKLLAAPALGDLEMEPKTVEMLELKAKGREKLSVYIRPRRFPGNVRSAVSERTGARGGRAKILTIIYRLADATVAHAGNPLQVSAVDVGSVSYDADCAS